MLARIKVTAGLVLKVALANVAALVIAHPVMPHLPTAQSVKIVGR
jgi:hypothetical protein